MATAAKAKTRQFEAEVQQVLHLMIHSLYSNKEIFLRELISNASDACDKLRFEAVKDDSLYAGDADLAIVIDYDKEAGTLTVTDNGIGMTEDEVVENIGTIARSGTRRFLDAMTGDDKKDAHLIGQFGVGFYSAFIVAEKVVLETRKAGCDEDAAVRWTSDGQGEYELESISKAARGTSVTLHLKEGEHEFLEYYRLHSLVSKYSDHIAFPIKMIKPAQPEEEESEEAKADEQQYEVVNRASALWTRAKSDIDDDEYKAFYKHVAHDFNDPLTWSHNRIEGNQSFTTLLYLPETAPFDMMMGRDDRERHGLKLYVKRVFIMDAAEQLLPNYLRFARGVVDSDDLPLNVSREILQDNALVSKIRASVTKRLLDMIAKVAKDDEKYAEFWKQFGATIKEGLAEDASNQEKLLELVRYASTQSEGEAHSVSLADYVARMKGEQDKIYYITADSYSAAKNSAHLELFRKKGIEVLLMSDRVDEWVMGHLREFEGKPFQSVAKGDIDLSNLEDDAEKAAKTEQEEAAKPLVERLEKALGDRVEDVRVSHRLTDSPSCLVLNQHDMAVHMQTLLKQAGQDQMLGSSKPKLEVNPQHELLKRAAAEEDDEKFAQWATLLFEQAWVAEGGLLEDPAGFVRRSNSLLLG